MKPMMVCTLFAMVFSTVAQAKTIDLTLRLNERTSIEELARNVMNPSSDRYRKFYTPAEIRNLVAPSDRDYQALLSSLNQTLIPISTITLVRAQYLSLSIGPYTEISEIK